MNELDGFRAEVDRIDTELARLLELRFDLCEEIGRYKRMNGLPIENCEREEELVAARTEGMLSHQSDAVAVFRMIIRRAKRIQKEKLNLYLVGMPGSGKSRTARRLARAIEKPVADTDKLAEKYAEENADPINAARNGYIDNIIEPQFVRAYVVSALQTLVR